MVLLSIVLRSVHFGKPVEKQDARVPTSTVTSFWLVFEVISFFVWTPECSSQPVL